MQSSTCLRLQNIVNRKIIARFKYSLSTDVASSRLKLAAILYCSGYIHAAVRVLEDVERRYHSKVKAVCGCRRIPEDRDLEMFADMLPGHSDQGFIEPQFAFCVTFVRAERHCTPLIFLFEMNRNIDASEVDQRTYTEKEWMDFAEVDARPFLHYLQYLTFRRLGERSKQQLSLSCLEYYICDNRNKINLYHRETAYNLLGHCCEMEGEYNRAFYFYTESLRLCCKRNNAANWHVLLLVWRLLKGPFHRF
ncbi:hypothetical protein DPMN_141098 [Dreissena polymorpha]|uniref:Uncharacterized protein n=1 Tax=Dreissena polymorpha TaxID=45954 RepID=A0A9D4JHA3_DREPO|nr:hypothetical protein DPMN_141098 [Dreissena polymorpha]